MSDTTNKMKDQTIIDFSSVEAVEMPQKSSALNKSDTSYWLEVNPAIKNHDEKYMQEKRLEFLIKQELLNRFR